MAGLILLQLGLQQSTVTWEASANMYTIVRYSSHHHLQVVSMLMEAIISSKIPRPLHILMFQQNNMKLSKAFAMYT